MSLWTTELGRLKYIYCPLSSPKLKLGVLDTTTPLWWMYGLKPVAMEVLKTTLLLLEESLPVWNIDFNRFFCFKNFPGIHPSPEKIIYLQKHQMPLVVNRSKVKHRAFGQDFYLIAGYDMNLIPCRVGIGFQLWFPWKRTSLLSLSTIASAKQ